jgi:hypothetical protein
MEFNIVNLKITVRTANPMLLHLRLAGQGNEFAVACKGVACRRPTLACERCSDRDGCAWHLVFGQGLAADPAALKRHQKPPLPFVFSLPLANAADNAPEAIECGLVVVGRAISCLEMLLEGFAELLERDSCQVPGEIIRVDALDYQGECRILGDGARVTRPENLAVLSAAGMVESRPWECSHLTISLRSPLKLSADGRQYTRFYFSLFARSLMRRISSLAYYYGDCELDNDFRDLSRQAETIVCSADGFCYGTPMGMGKKLSGIMGSGSFDGDFNGLMPFLVLGTLVHVGKGASYGMGRYELIADGTSQGNGYG